MKITELNLKGLKLIEPKKHGDERGFFSEVYHEGSLAAEGFSETFMQDNHAYSKDAYVLRGLHYQSPPFAQDKLVRVIRGAIWDVAVDIRKDSPTYGQWAAAELSAENFKQLLVPKGFAHGYLTLTPDSEVLYKVTNPYAPESDCGLLWDDSDLGIEWPLAGNAPILSAKDTTHPSFQDLNSPF